MKINRLALVLALAGASTFAFAQTSPKPGTTAASTTGPEERLLAKLHETNQMEIEFGQLAQQKASSPDVKDFGKQLVDDHQSADQKITALAKEKNLTLDAPAAMNDADAKKSEDMKATLAKLKSAEGAQFDQQFLKAMADGHTHAIQLVKETKPSIKDAQVKSLITELEPVLEKHRAMAMSGGHERGKAKASQKDSQSPSDNPSPRTKY
jgi:putative membrane protein